MTNSITSIESGIESLLSNITDLNSVLTYEPLTIPTPPCATISFLGFDSERTEVASLTVSYNFRVRLYFDLIDAETAAQQMKSIVWDTISALRGDPSLGGTCIQSQITRGEALYIELANRARPLEAFQIEITAIKEED